MWTYEEAHTYFTEEVLHNSWWIDADEDTRKRALKSSENELYQVFTRYKPTKRPLPNLAVYEQAIWLLRKDDVILRAEQGVTNVNLSGAIQMTVSGSSQKINPSVTRIINAAGGGRRGRYR